MVLRFQSTTQISDVLFFWVLYTNQQNRKDQRIIEYDPIPELTKNNRKIKKRKRAKKGTKKAKATEQLEISCDSNSGLFPGRYNAVCFLLFVHYRTNFCNNYILPTLIIWLTIPLTFYGRIPIRQYISYMESNCALSLFAQ
jgi:hypothetical protein